MSTEATRRALLKMLDSQLMPLVLQRETPPVLLMEPEYLRHTGRTLIYHEGEPLRYGRRMRSPILLQHWPEQRVHAIRIPCLLAVVEGEIDWRVGIVAQTELPQREQAEPASQAQANYMIVPVSAGTFFLTPAGVPYSDGEGIHWERSEPRKGRATLFWMQLLPSGFMCHLCRSSATEHFGHKSFFVLCPPVYPLVRLLENELREGQEQSAVLIRAHLQAILTYARRALQEQVEIVPMELENTPQEISSSGPVLAQDAIQRARTYIEANLRQALNPDTVASQAYLSARHLERHFQRELGMSITDYIIQRRVEVARVLLQETDLLIRQVGEMVGYPNQSSFSQIFQRHTGASPRAFRSAKTTTKIS